MKPTVVVGYDGSTSADSVLAQAGREAAWRGAAVEVVTAFHWIAVTTPVAYVPMNVESALKTGAQEVADAGVRWLREHHSAMAVRSRAVAGETADVIAAAARGAELLVLGNRGRGGFTGLLLGSVSMRTLGFASCPTMIVRGTPREPAGSIVLGLDVDDPGEESIEFAFAEAALRKARLCVLNAWGADRVGGSDPGIAAEIAVAKARAAVDARTALETSLNPWMAKYPEVRLDIEVADETPGAALVAASRTADLIVAGAHRRGDGSLGMRVGPIAHAVLHHADCPVVIVPRT
jgi:nucleotide-binding universal stress UspA family protein